MIKPQIALNLLAGAMLWHSASPACAQPRTWTMEDLPAVQKAASRARETAPESWWALNLAGEEKLLLRQDDAARKLIERSYRAAPNQEAATHLARLTYSADSAAGAKWALRALAFERPSLHALTIFETCVRVDPTLASKENGDTRRVRSHRDRWEARLEGYRGRIPTLGRDVVNGELVVRRWPTGSTRVAYANGTLKATSASSKVLWSRSMEQPLHTMVQSSRVVLAHRGKVEFLDLDTGRTLDEWTSPIPVTALRSRFAPAPPAWKSGEERGEDPPWKAWESPKEILAADDRRLFVDLGDWLMVLRQKGGGGWAHYFGRSLTGKIHGDTIVFAENHASVCAHALSTGKELWRVPSPVGGAVELLDVTAKEAIVYLPSVEQVRALSLSSGKTLWTLSHLDI